MTTLDTSLPALEANAATAGWSLLRRLVVGVVLLTLIIACSAWLLHASIEVDREGAAEPDTTASLAEAGR